MIVNKKDKILKNPFNIILLLIVVVIPFLTNINNLFPIALLIALIFFVIILRDLKYGLYIFAFGYPLISFIERGLVIPGLALNEVLLVFIGIIFLINIFTGKYQLERNGLLIPFMVYFFCAGFIPLFVTIINKQILTLKILLQFFASIQYYLILVMFQCVLKKDNEKKTLLFWVLGGSVIVSIIGIFQWFNIFNMSTLISKIYTVEWEKVVETDVSRFEIARRVTSTLNNWNGCGAYLGVTVFIAFFLLRFVKSVINRIIVLVIAILNTICLILTFSLTSYIMLIVMFLMLGLLTRRYKLILYFLLMFVSLVIVLAPFFEQQIQRQFGYGGWIPYSLLHREKIWMEEMVPQIMKHPLVGIGADYYRLEHVAESFYFFLLLSGGMLLLCAFFFLFFKMVYEAIQNIRIADDDFAVHLGRLALSLLIAVLIGNFTEPYFRFAGMAELIWILMAISYPIKI